jgi:hypothetical protein
VKTALLQSAQHPIRVWEEAGIPLKVGPLKFLHPKAIEVKNMQGNVPLCHSINKTGNCFFIIICCERR